MKLILNKKSTVVIIAVLCTTIGIAGMTLYVIISNPYVCLHWTDKPSTYVVQDKVKTRTLWNIYHITAPFGIIYVDIEGSGSILFSRITSNLEEVYIVKYIDGNLLKTLQFNTMETPLIVDGTFCLEHIITETAKYEVGTGENGSDRFIGWEDDWLPDYEERANYTTPTWGDAWYTRKEFWKIHSPELPILNSTMTKDYIR